MNNVSFGIATVAAVLALGAGVEVASIARLQHAATTVRDAGGPNAPDPQRVAASQELVRERDALHASGDRSALPYVRLGNAIPHGARIDDVRAEDGAFVVTGGARDTATVSQAVDALGAALPDAHAALVDVESRSHDALRLRFHARVSLGTDAR